VTERHEKHLSELNDEQAKQIEILQQTHNDQVEMFETEAQIKTEHVTQLESDLERVQE